MTADVWCYDAKMVERWTLSTPLAPHRPALSLELGVIMYNVSNSYYTCSVFASVLELRVRVRGSVRDLSVLLTISTSIKYYVSTLMYAKSLV